MLPYQETYIENTRKIHRLIDGRDIVRGDFSAWLKANREADAQIEALRRENVSLLNGHLFPLLDDLHNASPEAIEALEAFGAALMDWSNNLDCGVYVLIHDSLLSMYRIRRDRSGMIKELYQLGMGLYYQNRALQGIDQRFVHHFLFQNEMVFTEGGSYLKLFPEIKDEATRGYIIRCLANIAITTPDYKRRIRIGANVLEIAQDKEYRAMAPGLPWDTFIWRTHQQMSSNRHVMGKGDLSTRELMQVLESCHEVFKTESENASPNVRWLWPYYEMEYTCGFADVKTTAERLEKLICGCSYDQYDVSGLYANVQLAIYYGKLLRNHSSLREDPGRVAFLAEAYRKMMRTITTYPGEKGSELFAYNVRLVLCDYFETEGVESYRSVLEKLLKHFFGRLYIRGRRAGGILERYCEEILRWDQHFFDDIPFLQACDSFEEKRGRLLDYARACGLFHDIGKAKMNMQRIPQIRNLFETEYQMERLHTVAGYEELVLRESTRVFADVALGHHAWYQGEGYPKDYVRNQSPYRQMTDVTAVVAYLIDHCHGEPEQTIQAVIRQEGKRFSPMVTAFLSNEALRRDLIDLLTRDDGPLFQELYEAITA